MPQIYISDILDAYLITNDLVKGEVIVDIGDDDISDKNPPMSPDENIW